MKSKEEIYDQYAAAALQALITKFPMIDKMGEYGKKITDKEEAEIKRDLCRTAHGYAAWMMVTRTEYEQYQNENPPTTLTALSKQK